VEALGAGGGSDAVPTHYTLHGTGGGGIGDGRGFLFSLFLSFLCFFPWSVLFILG